VRAKCTSLLSLSIPSLIAHDWDDYVYHSLDDSHGRPPWDCIVRIMTISSLIGQIMALTRQMPSTFLSGANTYFGTRTRD
jgi:hypothetical protein